MTNNYSFEETNVKVGNTKLTLDNDNMQKDVTKVWDQCLSIIKANISEDEFNNWFLPVKAIKLDDKTLKLLLPSEFYYDQLENHYIDVLHLAIKGQLGNDFNLEYELVMDKGAPKPKTVNIQPSNQQINSPTLNLKLTKDKKDIFKEYQKFFDDIIFKENYIFDNFVEGNCNQLARSAGYSIAKKPGVNSFNPFMIYGGVGLGKTHLVQAIANHIRANNPDKVVVYVSSEKFTNQFIDELKNNNLQNLTNFYLLMDVLIIDDVQFLSGKERTQELFFHIFNHLHERGKQIIMTSDRSPNQLKGLQDRLLSRFKMGLTADLQQPDYETRLAIIHRKLDGEGIKISDEIIQYLANVVDSNIRELEGVIVSLLAQSSFAKKAIDKDLCDQVIQQIAQSNVGGHDQNAISIEQIQTIVSDYYKVAVNDLTSKSRKKHLATARQVAMYFSKEYTEFSLKSIGFQFGGRDHSTVIYAVTKVNEQLKDSEDMRDTISSLRKLLIGKI